MKTTPKPTALILVKEKPIEALVKKNEKHLQLTKVEAHALAFAEPMAEYLKLAEKAKVVGDDAKEARSIRLDMVKVRTGVEKVKDERKEGVRAEGDLIQGLYNVVKNSCMVTEGELMQIERAEEIAEQKRQAEVKATRVQELNAIGDDSQDWSSYPIDVMSDTQFATFVRTMTVAYNVRKQEEDEAVKLAEAKRKEQEAAVAKLKEVEAEKARVESELRAERSKQAAIVKAEKDKADVLAKGTDKEKVTAFYADFKSLTFPQLTSDPGAVMTAKVNEALEIVRKLIIQESKKLM